MVLLTVSGVLLVTAAATAFFGNGFSDATPHERLLGVLEAASQQQAAHYRQQGEFASRSEALALELPPDVDFTVLRGDRHGWELLATARDHDLTCSQMGRWERGTMVREQPTCYTRGY